MFDDADLRNGVVDAIDCFGIFLFSIAPCSRIDMICVHTSRFNKRLLRRERPAHEGKKIIGHKESLCRRVIAASSAHDGE
jgi:hypothetical protein